MTFTIIKVIVKVNLESSPVSVRRIKSLGSRARVCRLPSPFFDTEIPESGSARVVGHLPVAHLTSNTISLRPGCRLPQASYPFGTALVQIELKPNKFWQLLRN